MKKILVSVTVPVYNRSEEIESCLKSLVRQRTTFPYEIIVIDDGSTDNTTSVINKWKRRYPSKIRILSRSKNEGSSKARNFGIKHAKGKIIAFIDSDCVAKPEWLENLTLPIRKGNEEITNGYSEGETKNVWQKITQESFDRVRKNTVKKGYIETFDTKNAAVLKTVFYEVGMFFLRNSYDFDFGARCIKRDFKIKHVANARLIHRHRTSLKLILKVSFKYCTSYALLLRRNPHYIMRNLHEVLPFIAGFIFSILIIGAPLFSHINAQLYLLAISFFSMLIIIRTWTKPYYLLFHRLVYHIFVSMAMFAGLILGIPKAIINKN